MLGPLKDKSQVPGIRATLLHYFPANAHTELHFVLIVCIRLYPTIFSTSEWISRWYYIDDVILRLLERIIESMNEQRTNESNMGISANTLRQCRIAYPAQKVFHNILKYKVGHCLLARIFWPPEILLGTEVECFRSIVQCSQVYVISASKNTTLILYWHARRHWTYGSICWNEHIKFVMWNSLADSGSEE